MPHPSGRSFQIDFDSHRVDILPVSGRGRSIALASRSVADFHTDLMGSLDELDLINADLANARGDRRGHSLTGRYFARVLDLAITRFSGRTAPPHPGGAPHCGPAVMHEAYSHELSSACYWPGGDTEGVFYAYDYPESDGFRDFPIPTKGAYFSVELGEFVLPYRLVRTAADPDSLLMGFLQSTYEAAAICGNWDRQALERRG